MMYIGKLVLYDTAAMPSGGGGKGNPALFKIKVCYPGLEIKKRQKFVEFLATVITG